MNLKATMNNGLKVAGVLGRELVSKENGMNALKILGGVGIGIAAVTLGTEKKQRMFGGTTKAKNGRKIAIVGTLTGSGVTAALALGKAIPKIRETIKSAAEFAEDVTE